MTERPNLIMVREELDKLSKLILGIPGDEFLKQYQSEQIIIIDPRSPINYLADIADALSAGPNLHIVKDDDNSSKQDRPPLSIIK